MKAILEKRLAQFYQNKNILITGGAGFIGSHLADRLVQLGCNVTVLDNLSTGKVENLSKSLHKIKLIIGDITSSEICKKVLVDQEIVFHTAAITSVVECEQNYNKCLATNIEGTANLLNLSRHLEKFIFSSSAAVYGNKNTVCKETDFVEPISNYGQSKLKGELLCKSFSEKNNVKTVILRYFNVYGKRQAANSPTSSVVAQFSKKLIQGQKLTIFGDGKQTRDFINVKQVVEANVLTGAFSDRKFSVFNIASGKSISLLEMITKLETVLKVKRKGIEFKPARQGDIQTSRADNSKYKYFMYSIQKKLETHASPQPYPDIYSDRRRDITNK